MIGGLYMKNKKHDGKHLTISQRIIIEKGLGDHESFKAIATRIGKDPTTVAKEVKNHIFESVKSDIEFEIDESEDIEVITYQQPSFLNNDNINE